MYRGITKLERSKGACEIKPDTVFTAITLSKKKIFSIERYVRMYDIETFFVTQAEI